MIDPERIHRLAEKMGNRNDALELVRQMRCGGRKFGEGGPGKKRLFDKKKIADRIPADGGYPGGTSGVIDAVRHYLSNDDNYVGDRIRDAMVDASRGVLDPESLSQMLAHEDAKRIYLGMPQEYGSFEPSPYRPTIGSMDDPYQLNGLLSDSSFENTILPMYATWKTGKDWPLYDTGSRVTNLGKTAQLSDFPYLHRAGMSEGFDDKGQYISLQDTWDYNTAVKGRSGDNVGKWIGGKPFDIYQRYYLDDWLDVPDEAKGNPYIAPSYIEADYTGPRYVPDYTFWGLPQDRGELDSTNEFGCGGKKYPDGGKFFRTNLQNESPMMYQPMKPWMPDVSVPMRFIPEPNYGDYVPPSSTGMAESYPITVGVNVPERGYGVLLPVDEAPVSVLDPVKDAARRIMAVENSKESASGGWDAKTGRWYPHKSIEGGADTIAYGIKLSNGTPEAALALKQGYLTDEQATQFADTLAQRYYDAAKRVYDGKYGDGEWDKLSDKSQSILVDYSYNPGLAKFPKLMEGFHSGNLDLIRKNYKRYSGGKELGRNKVLLEELDTLENEYPIFRKNGGKIHIKPENRGKFTALKKRTGHSASWFKAHGTPAQKKMAVFELNSRHWGNRKDEGGVNLIAEYPEGYNGELRQGKSFNAWDRYLANHPMAGHRLRKAKTLLLDAARVHPLTSFATDVYDSYVGPQDESDKITTPLGVVGRGGDIILNTVKQAGEIEPDMKKVFGRSAFGRLISLPDFIDDASKFVKDFAEPVTNFENGGYLLGHVYDLSEEQVNELIRQGYEVERV